MAKIKLTKSVVDAATFRAQEYELRDTVVPGFLLKLTPAGRKIFMLQYRTNAGERRKPAIGRFGELRAHPGTTESKMSRLEKKRVRGFQVGIVKHSLIG